MSNVEEILLNENVSKEDLIGLGVGEDLADVFLSFDKKKRGHVVEFFTKKLFEVDDVVYAIYAVNDHSWYESMDSLKSHIVSRYFNDAEVVEMDDGTVFEKSW